MLVLTDMSRFLQLSFSALAPWERAQRTQPKVGDPDAGHGSRGCRSCLGCRRCRMRGEAADPMGLRLPLLSLIPDVRRQSGSDSRCLLPQLA